MADQLTLGVRGKRCTRREMLSGGIALSIAPSSMNACAAAVGGITLDVMDFIPAHERAAIVAGTSGFDCTASIQKAILRAERTKGTLRIGKGTYTVSTLRITGSAFHIDTENGATFKQIKNIPSDQAHPVIIFDRCFDLIIGDLSIIGNIETDLSEHHHAVLVGRSKNVTIGDIFARNIRGDALYCYGRKTNTSERLDNLRVRSVSGHNVFRNLVSVAGGQVRIDAIINAGPVGYRDLDVEPNAEGEYQPGEVVVGRAVVGSLEVTSDDPRTRNLSVTIGEFDADGRRIQPTTPAYPNAPGRNGYALGLAHVARVEIARATLRNYASYAINLGQNHGEIWFRDIRIANCDFDERTFNSAIAKRGRSIDDRLSIDRLCCVHPDNSKWLIHSDQPGMPVVIRGGEISGGLLAVNCIVDARNLAIDAGGAHGSAANLLVRGGGSRLASILISGAQDATLLFDSPGCSLVSVSGTVAAIADGDSIDMRITDSAIKTSHRNPA